jgi:AcrR family transcriptional regulator
MTISQERVPQEPLLTKSAQSDRTRASLIAVARSMFAERGYGPTPTEEIVAAAGVTRGALYHHFRDKLDLFEAVYLELQDEMRARISEAYGNTLQTTEDRWEALRAGFHEYLDHSMDPEVQRIVLLDAPSVLGWERWREIDISLDLLQTGLGVSRDEGVLDERLPVDETAHLMLGVVSEASHLIAQSRDVERARASVGALVDHFLDALRGSNGAAAG